MEEKFTAADHQNSLCIDKACGNVWKGVKKKKKKVAVFVRVNHAFMQCWLNGEKQENPSYSGIIVGIEIVQIRSFCNNMHLEWCINN